MMDAARAAHVLQGNLVGPNVRFMRVTSDTRMVEPGDLFVALKGERFDGHDFVATAFERGACAALVTRDRVRTPGSLIEVDDSLAALGRLAAHWRRQFDIPVIVVVGSNGKTTVKEMTASILRAHMSAARPPEGANVAPTGGSAAADAAGAGGRQFGEDVLATRGNLNNAIGLPLTLLGLRSHHRAAVIELGMNHPGETAELAAIAQPTIALINNAQREHQEFMRSVADVAREHAQLLRYLPAAGGTAVINADDAHVNVWRDAVPSGVAVMDFALSHPAATTAQCGIANGSMHLRITTTSGVAEAVMQVAGRHNASNALAASAAALAAGASLAAVTKGLEAFRPVAGRLVARRGLQGESIIDDTYNANPDSVKAAIAVLASAPTPRWLVLGDMGEVGSEGPAFHREAGELARSSAIDRLFTAGTLAAQASDAFGRDASHFASVEALAEHLANADRSGVTILVKGSRFMRMERVVARLCGEAHEGTH